MLLGFTSNVPGAFTGAYSRWWGERSGRGGVVILWALRSLSRRAVVLSAHDTLVADGPYRYVRHPIHVGTFLEFMGLWLFVPSLTVMVACVVGVIWLLVQSRLEEVDLLDQVSGYRQYMADVPHFLPHLRRG